MSSFLQHRNWRLKLEGTLVTLLNDFWDQARNKTIPRRRIDFTSELDGIKFASYGIEGAPLLLPQKKILASTELSVEVKDTKYVLMESNHWKHFLNNRHCKPIMWK